VVIHISPPHASNIGTTTTTATATATATSIITITIKTTTTTTIATQKDRVIPIGWLIIGGRVLPLRYTTLSSISLPRASNTEY